MRSTGKVSLTGLGLVLVLVLALARPADNADEFKLVVNPANPVASLRRRDLSDMFLGKKIQWPSGGRVLPVDQSATSPVRAAFTRTVHGKSVENVVNYWLQIIFSGRGVPPASKPGDAEVMAFVRADPGAVGYVSPAAAATGLTVITLEP
jgi:ABC-type phosphate transport system substrate-binding protein